MTEEAPNAILEMTKNLTKASEDLAAAFSEVLKVEAEIDMFERNVRLSDPTYSEVMNAKNDTQRKLILERAYNAPPNEGVWYELQGKLREARVQHLKVSTDVGMAERVVTTVFSKADRVTFGL